MVHVRPQLLPIVPNGAGSIALSLRPKPQCSVPGQEVHRIFTGFGRDMVLELGIQSATAKIEVPGIANSPAIGFQGFACLHGMSLLVKDLGF